MSVPFSTATHPLAIISSVRRLAFILLVPILRGLLNFGASGILSATVKWELALIAALGVLGFLRWRKCRIVVSGEIFCMHSGVFINRSAVIKLTKITCVAVERQPLIDVFGAVKVTVSTDAGRGNRAKLKFYLSHKRANALCTAIGAQVPKNRIYLCSAAHIVLMSLSNASALSGLLIAASVVENLGRLLGNALEERLLETITLVNALTNRLVPPAASILAAALVIGFFVSFLLTLLKHSSFVVRSSSTTLAVEQGIIWRKRSVINQRAVLAAIITAPPLLRIFGCCSLRLVASGFGNGNGEKSVVFPVEKISRARRSMQTLGIRSCCHDITLKVPRRAIRRAVFVPTVILICIIGGVVLAQLFESQLAQLASVVGVCAAVVDLYWLALRLYHSRHGGAHLSGDVRVLGYKALTMTDGYFDLERIESIKVSEGPFDRRHGFCSLRVTALGKQAASVKTVNLDKRQVLNELNRLYDV